MSEMMAWVMRVRWARTIFFSIFLLLGVQGLNWTGVFSFLEYTSLNQAYRMRTDVPINPKISFWNIDDNDIEMSRWPWGWDRYAYMIKAMNDYGVEMSVFQEDTFSDPGMPAITREAMEAEIENLAERLDDVESLNAYLQKDERTPREALSYELEQWPHAIFSQYFLIPDDQTYETVEMRKEVFKKEFLKSKRQKIKAVRQMGKTSHETSKSLLGAINISPIDDALTPHVKGVGFMRILPDSDGIIRQVPTVVRYDGSLFLSQPLVAAAEALGCELENIEVVPGRAIIFHGVPSIDGKGDLSIPIDETGRMYVSWTQEEQLAAFDQVPFGIIKTLMARELCRKIAKETPLDFEDPNGVMGGIRKIQERYNEEVLPLGWLKAYEASRYLPETICAWLFQNALLAGLEQSDVIDDFLSPIFGEGVSSFDMDLMYQSITMNTVLGMVWEDPSARPQNFEAWLNHEDYSFSTDRLMVGYFEEYFDDELEMVYAEQQLIAIDENYTGEYSRLKVLHLDLDRQEYRVNLAIKMEKTTEEVEASGLMGLYDLMMVRRKALSSGFEHTKHFLEKGELAEVGPLYFGLPIAFTFEGADRDITLLDFKDRIVFVGLTATGLNALNPTPYVGRYPMASLTPTTFNTITTGSFISRMDWLGPVLATVYVLAIFALVFYTSALVSLPLTLMLAVGHYFLGLYLLDEKGLIISLVFPVIAVMSAYIVANIYIYIEQKRERQKVRGMFAAMVSPEVLKIMEEEPDRFNLRGEKVEASMFSSDVSGFTSISEGVTAQELALILNLYLTPMSNLVMTYGGYVEKYEGDAIKADFGMPLPDGEHAWKACFSALLQQEELTVVQRMLQIKYGVMITARMGVNTGVVNAGNMGSEKKMQYCAIGHEVAMAEELEPSNKMWETWIAISPETLRLSGDKLDTRLLDVVEYDHVTIPVYELLGWDEKAFGDYWTGKPIPALVIEGWERIIPEKVLAYLDYYHQRRFEGNAFYDLLIKHFEGLEDLCMDYVIVNDKVELSGMESRYQGLLLAVDERGIELDIQSLDPVDKRELDGLKSSWDAAKEPWLKRLNGYLYELKIRTHKVTRMMDQIEQVQADEWNTAIDTLEKNCNCYIKRNRFPEEGDRYGMKFKSHLCEILPEPTQGLSEEQLQELRAKRTECETQLKQKMQEFVAQAKGVSEDYHRFMAGHCLLSEKKKKVCEIFKEGRELYLDRQWEAARAKFMEGLELVPDDGPCMKFIERCDDFEKNPPDEKWDGTWEADW